MRTLVHFSMTAVATGFQVTCTIDDDGKPRTVVDVVEGLGPIQSAADAMLRAFDDIAAAADVADARAAVEGVSGEILFWARDDERVAKLQKRKAELEADLETKLAARGEPRVVSGGVRDGES